MTLSHAEYLTLTTSYQFVYSHRWRVIVTSADRARDARHPRVLIRAVAGRVCKPRADMHYQTGPISTVAGK